MIDNVQKIIGTVEYIKYQNENNSFAIIELMSEDRLITVTGNVFGAKEGEEIEIEGKFSNHHVYGTQFNASHFVRKLPSTVNGILKYLSSNTIKNIGKVMAKRIVDTFGEETFEVLKGDKERLCTIKGISPSKADMIINEYKNMFCIQNLIVFFQQMGINTSFALKAYKIYGEQSKHIIEENPYILCSEDIGVDFLDIDCFVEKLQLDLNSENRIKAGVVYTLRHNINNGHTCIPYNKLIKIVSSFLEASDELVENCITKLLDENNLFLENINSVDFLFLPSVYYSERYISSKLAMLSLANNNVFEEDIDEIIQNHEIDINIKYNERQKEAIRCSCTSSLMVLTGGPGTGKTTTINSIIDILEKKFFNVALCAPTGRAAQRIENVTGRPSKTIHRLLEVDFKDGSTIKFIKNENNLLKYDAIIVDEISMVDVFLLSALLKAIKNTTKLILVGDYNQLPCVGAGNVLKDIIESRTIKVIELDEIFRQSSESLIVTNSHKIISGEKLDLKNKSSDFFFLQEYNKLNALNTVRDLYSTRLSSAYGLSPIWDIQILCPSRKGELGTQNINLFIRDFVNPKSKDKAEINYNGIIFRENDKVMQIKNNYDVEYQKNGESIKGIYNGDIGIITKINNLYGTVEINFEGKVITYNSDMLFQIELAYAITVHKSQGSEFEAVVFPVMENKSQLYYRNLLYTAVTRAKKILIIVGKEESVYTMIENNRKILHYTGLKKFLEEELKND